MEKVKLQIQDRIAILNKIQVRREKLINEARNAGFSLELTMLRDSYKDCENQIEFLESLLNKL